MLLVVLIFLSSCGDDPVSPVDETQIEGYSLVWADEFNSPEIETANWVYELGDGTDYGLPAGWGNAEKQLYQNSSENSFIEEVDGVSALVIVADEISDGIYHSAKLTTQGLQSFRYGRVEARMKLPTAQGMWPAFWMLGDNITEVDWPGCGEIDIMELVGSSPNTIHGSAHYATAENKHFGDTESKDLAAGAFDDEYHTFSINWTPESIAYSLDGAIYNSIAIEDDMKEFQRSFYIILNVAVGGNWPGHPDASTSFPQKMYVDYVRVYEMDGFEAHAAPALDIAEETIGVVIEEGITQYAFNSSFAQFPGIELKSFGDGGEPEIATTGVAIEGDSALVFSYPGAGWGGGWFQMDDSKDMSSFQSGSLIFSILSADNLANAEVKLEAVSNSFSVFLADYESVAVDNGYVEYTIPIADFIDLDLTKVIIPFALWNPVNDAGEFAEMEISVDNIYWE